MIESAQGYEIVTPVGLIDGGILPARDVEANGLAHTIRAEDLCFAIEATRERDLYGHYMASLYPTPSLVPRLSAWELVWSMFRTVSFWTGAFDPNQYQHAIDSAEQFAGITYTQGNEGSTPTELSLLYPSAYVQSCYGSVADRRRVLDLSSMWRGFYYDLLRADRFQIRQSFSGSYTASSSYGDTYTTQVTSANGEPTGTRRHLQEIAYDQTGSDPSQRYRSSQYGIVSASLSTSVPLPGLVTSAKLIAVYNLVVQELPGYKTATNYYFTRSFDVSVVGSSVYVPAGFFLPASSFDLLTVCDGLGHTLPPSFTPTSLWNNTGAYVYCAKSFLVANYNFRTNNLNSSASRAYGWNWAP